MSWTTRLLRSGPARLGGGIVLLLCLAAAFAPLLAPYGPETCSLEAELARPSPLHWLGADPDGCDILSLLLYGARISLKVGILVVAVSTTIGVVLGGLAGSIGGRLDRSLLFVIECFQAFPGILLAIAITAVQPGRSINLVILALCVSVWV